MSIKASVTLLTRLYALLADLPKIIRSRSTALIK
jgi:hypothetical protein